MTILAERHHHQRLTSVKIRLLAMKNKSNRKLDGPAKSMTSAMENLMKMRSAMTSYDPNCKQIIQFEIMNSASEAPFFSANLVKTMLLA